MSDQASTSRLNKLCSPVSRFIQSHLGWLTRWKSAFSENFLAKALLLIIYITSLQCWSTSYDLIGLFRQDGKILQLSGLLTFLNPLACSSSAVDLYVALVHTRCALCAVTSLCQVGTWSLALLYTMKFRDNGLSVGLGPAAMLHYWWNLLGK